MYKVLCEIEKLEGAHPGVTGCVRDCLARGIKTAAIPAVLKKKFGVAVTRGMVQHFRSTRWVPETNRTQEKKEAIKAAIEAFGGDAGLDAAILAKLWELMDQMTVSQLISARTLFIKVRAQNLKEQEFLYKTGQLKPGGEQEIDRETQQRNVLRRVKEIFGLADEEPQARPAGPENSAAPPVDSPVAAASTEVAGAAESRKGGASAPPLGMPQ